MNQFKIILLLLALVSLTLGRVLPRDLTYSRIYKIQKGKNRGRGKYEERPSRNIIGENNKYPCGESDSVHIKWTEARDQARLLRATGREVSEMSLEALAHSDLTGKQLACLAFSISINESIEQCAAILYSREIGLRQGVEYDTATQWTEDIVRRIYPWYRGFDITCAREGTR
mmetsp:Transcript_10092/g.8888  ORF Transcript_10092/g.8888 Transcript_10092/m.8888 type:complete len:172 (+) Transcript_10092:8-523(+)